MNARISLNQSPGKTLLATVRAGYIVKGTSLYRWCQDNGINRQYAAEVLTGRRNGPKAKALRQRLITNAA
jgi:hypothetical protein